MLIVSIPVGRPAIGIVFIYFVRHGVANEKLDIILCVCACVHVSACVRACVNKRT